MSLFDAAVDLNPHQIEAAVFALQSPLSQGVILADEVGLGKTIEAGIVLCQLWAERRRRLLVICPASLRKQWALELQEKFNLPALVLDTRSHRELLQEGRSPFAEQAILILSFNYAYKIRDQIKAASWDMVVIDEAHKLRNAYRPSNRVGQAIRWATEGCRKLLLTATPLQNSLLELYGLATLIDDRLFGDVTSFRAQYMSAHSDLGALRERLSTFCRRTLRKQVTEYVRFTERRAITQPFSPTDDEHALYQAISSFLRKPDSYALPRRQRHLTSLILRKLLASSPLAIAHTLDKLVARLEALREQRQASDADLAAEIAEAEELGGDLLDEILAESEEPSSEQADDVIDLERVEAEIQELRRLASWARSIGVDTKARALREALEIGFRQMAAIGAARKALIFTESTRTQEYLKNYLEMHGYAGQVVVFNGSNNSPEATRIYEDWVRRNAESGRVTGSRAVDVRTALIEHFRDEVSIMIATEAAAEGVNLQFCSLIINYDLPWNPQRIEQRIGRCHRYGQKYDVVVINFLNQRNEADRRVLELLTEKFHLFEGVFGASDEVLGSIESGVDFEKRILTIYQECRTPDEIDAAFRALREELDAQIRRRMESTRRILFEHFDEDVHQRLRIQLADARAHLDRIGQRFWTLTRFVLDGSATFDDEALAFTLHTPSADHIPRGRYHLISKSKTEPQGILYRLSHPLGEYVLSTAKALPTPEVSITFDVSHHPTRLHVVEALRGMSGYLTLNRLAIESYEREEYLLFSGVTDSGASLDQETMEKLMGCASWVTGPAHIPEPVAERLAAEAERHIQATINRSLEANSRHFRAARERLEKWAEDMVLSAERALHDTKEQITVLRRQARQAATLEEEYAIQEKLRQLEWRLRRQRQEIFAIEDEIMAKRDELIADLERRLARRTETEHIFTIRWTVV